MVRTARCKVKKELVVVPNWNAKRKDEALAIASDERRTTNVTSTKSHFSHRGRHVAGSLTHPRNFNLASLQQQIISARTHLDDPHPLNLHISPTNTHISYRKYGRHVHDCRKAGWKPYRTLPRALSPRTPGKALHSFANPQLAHSNCENLGTAELRQVDDTNTMQCNGTNGC